MAREIAGSRVTRMGSRTLVAETVAVSKQMPPKQGATQTADKHTADTQVQVPDRLAGRGNMMRPLFLVPHRLTAEERHRRIGELAYRRASQRGFAPGNEVEDWLEAEREVDAGRY
jgi:hypothetical protein